MGEDLSLRQEHLVVFKVANESFGLDISSVQEIIRPQQITSVPEMPLHMKGVISLRGKVIPVVDLRDRLGLTSGGETKSTRVVIVDILGSTVGMIVDAVSEVLQIEENQVEPPSPIVESYEKYLRGIGRFNSDLILLLDIEKLVPEAAKLGMVA